MTGRCPEREDADSALVLEPAAGIDEHPFVQGDVPAEISGERREHGNRFVHRFTGELGQQLPYLFRLVVAAVEFAGNPQCGLAGMVHGLMQGRAGRYGLTGVQRCEQFIKFHWPNLN